MTIILKKSLYKPNNILNIFNLKKRFFIYKPNKGHETVENRHFPPANKEWYNSIYAYNKNTTKLLPIADKVLFKLIKSYLNLFSRKLERKIKSRRLRLNLRRLSTNRILVSRAELKHTTDKVIVTLYVYNRQLRYYLNKVKKIVKTDFFYGKPYGLKLKVIRKQSFEIISKVLKQKRILFNTLSLDQNVFSKYENRYLKLFLKKSLKKEIICLYLKQIITFNKSKFEKFYLLPLNGIIKKVYNKTVHFNFVSLKYLYLNSHIYTQTVITKIKNRKNMFLRVLKTSILMLKYPKIKKVFLKDNRYNRDIKIQNLKINNLLCSTLFSNKRQDNDTLQNILQTQLKENFFIELLPNSSKNKNDIMQNVLNSVKNKSIIGIRLKAAGRLTKRYTAARSLRKVRFKGNIKNIDSSRKGLSTVILRGHVKSNIQYTKLKSHIRIGSFGVKGWISSY